MTTGFFDGIAPVTFEGPDSTNPMAFRHDNLVRVVVPKGHGVGAVWSLKGNRGDTVKKTGGHCMSFNLG